MEATQPKRYVADCRNVPSVNNCSVTIAGTKDEIVPLIAHHMVTAHGHEDTPELREMIKASLKEEK